MISQATNPNSETLLLNSLTQKVKGDDTTFTLALQKNYQCSTIVLNQVCFVNLFSNMRDNGNSIFGFQLADGRRYEVDAKYQSMALADIVAYINRNLIQNVFTITINNYKVTLTSSVSLFIYGNGWRMFGFDDSQIGNGITGQLFVAQHYYDTAASLVVYIAFTNLINSSMTY